MKPIPIAFLGAPRPYCQAVLHALDGSRYDPQTPDDVVAWADGPEFKVILIMVGHPDGWSDVNSLAALPQTVVIVLTRDLRFEQFARALALGCDGVVHSDTTSEAIVEVIEAAIRGKVVLPSEMVRRMAKAIQHGAPRPSTLRTDELDLIRAIANGATITQLASDLGWSERTLNRRLHKIYVKLGVNNKARAIARASRIGLLE